MLINVITAISIYMVVSQESAVSHHEIYAQLRDSKLKQLAWVVKAKRADRTRERVESFVVSNVMGVVGNDCRDYN